MEENNAKILGEHLVFWTLSSAYLTIAKTPVYVNTSCMREAFDSLVFVVEGKLDNIITTFGLHYDGNKLTEMFIETYALKYEEMMDGQTKPSEDCSQKINSIIYDVQTFKDVGGLAGKNPYQVLHTS